MSYQPLIDLRTHAIVGFEATLTWKHAVLGDVPAERFISVADECGLIHELAEGVLRQACAAASQWPPTTALSVDIYPAQLADRTLTTSILQILEESGLSPRRLEIEVAESDLVRHLESVQDVLCPLREKGVKIAIGNFGTGYSSLYHLRMFKFDKIKIDRAFIESMGSDPKSAEIVNALIGLGHGFGFTVSADGVGDLKQSTTLLGGGCQQGQGSFFAGDMSAESITDFLTRHNSSQAKLEVVDVA